MTNTAMNIPTMAGKGTAGNIALEVRRLTHWFGPRTVLFDLNFEVMAGEFVALVGPSGCGKTTLLRAILGTHPAREGTVTIYKGPAKTQPMVVRRPGRDRGIVFQQYSLFPDKTALENVALGPKFDESSIPDRVVRWLPRYRPHHKARLSWARLRRAQLDEAAALLEKLKLDGAGRKYPHELSGGMRQRVAIAQALVMKPSILLLDEPFGALDEATREELQTMLLELYTENVAAAHQGLMPPYTIIIVTHEINEAILVGDRVLGLSQYWNSAEHPDPRAKGAATIVYDDIAPVFLPTQARDFGLFIKQREEIRRLVFDPNVLQGREKALRFWDRVGCGDGQGVLSNDG